MYTAAIVIALLFLSAEFNVAWQELKKSKERRVTIALTVFAIAITYSGIVLVRLIIKLNSEKLYDDSF